MCGEVWVSVYILYAFVAAYKHTENAPESDAFSEAKVRLAECENAPWNRKCERIFKVLRPLFYQGTLTNLFVHKINDENKLVNLTPKKFLEHEY